jgi:hypothetical protein
MIVIRVITKLLLLYREIFSVCSENQINHTNTLWCRLIFCRFIKRMVYKVSTLRKRASHCRNWRKIFQNYSLEPVHVTWSQCYNTVNTTVDYSAVKVYLLAFSATARDGDVQLTSTFNGYFRTEITTGTYRIRGVAWQKGRIGRKKILLHNYGNWTRLVHNVGKSSNTMI